jgi:hypothetical protein
MALSHCWGGDQTVKLMTLSIKNMQSGFFLVSFPKSIEDAVRIAWWFELEYLRVDILCISQEDIEDWIQEAQWMDFVYRNLILKIAAQGAQASKDGCSAMRNALMLNRCRLIGEPSGPVLYTHLGG